MKRLLTTSCTNSSFNIAAFVLRIVFGSMLIWNHGIPKIRDFSNKLHTFSDPFGIGHQASFLLVLFAEVFCTVFIILGLFTRLAAIPVVIMLLVIIFMVNKGDPIAKLQPAILFLAAFTAILFMGSGKYSLDGAMGK